MTLRSFYFNFAFDVLVLFSYPLIFPLPLYSTSLFSSLLLFLLSYFLSYFRTFLLCPSDIIIVFCTIMDHTSYNTERFWHTKHNDQYPGLLSFVVLSHDDVTLFFLFSTLSRATSVHNLTAHFPCVVVNAKSFILTLTDPGLYFVC